MAKTTLSEDLLGNKRYIFHFDVSDYYVSDARLYGSFAGDTPRGGSTGHVYIAQTDVFLNLSFIDFTFTKDDTSVVLAVSSETLDFFSPVNASLSSCNEADVRKILAILFFVALVILLWKPVVAPLLGLIWKIICFPLKYFYAKSLLRDKDNNRTSKSKSKRRRKK